MQIKNNVVKIKLANNENKIRKPPKNLKHVFKNIFFFSSYPSYPSPLSSYGYNPPLNSNMNIQPQPPQYDGSADFVDSTTTYEPNKSGGFLDTTDFIGHGEFILCVSIHPDLPLYRQYIP